MLQFNTLVVLRWNLLDDVTVNANCKDGKQFQVKTGEREGQKMGLFLDYCSLESQAVTDLERPS